MKWLRAPMLALMLLVAGVLPGDTDPLSIAVPPVRLPQENAPFTFFAWSDQHVSSEGRVDHLLPALEAMRTLPGRGYPLRIGGAVARPEFVFSAGDCTDWPTRQAAASYVRSMSRLGLPHLEILGNHDEGDDPHPRWPPAPHPHDRVSRPPFRATSLAHGLQRDHRHPHRYGPSTGHPL